MEEKMCCNCKYTSASIFEEPCMSCKLKSNWVDASMPKKFKFGDLVIAKISYKESKILYIYLRNKWVLRVPYFVTVGSNAIICSSKHCLSNYVDKWIADGTATWIDDLVYASPEIIEKHDKSARLVYECETLNEWFSRLLIGEELKKKDSKSLCNDWTVKDPGLGFKDYGKGVDYNKGTVKLNYVRYDKFPTFNGNFIKKVIFSDPATIIFWEDGTKTVVKTQDGEVYDKEKGLAMSISKRVFGNERDYYNVFKRWMRKGEDRHEET